MAAHPSPSDVQSFVKDTKYKAFYQNSPSFKLDKNLSSYTHYSEVLCCGFQKERILGVVLAIFALIIGAIAAFLLKGGFSSIPSFTTGCSFALASMGLFATSIVLLCRRSQPHPFREMKSGKLHEEMI